MSHLQTALSQPTDTRAASADRVDILGLHVSRVNVAQTLRLIDGYIARGERRFVVAPNVFCLTYARRDETYRCILNSADLTLPDGVPLVWASRLFGEPVGSRVSGADLFETLTAHAAARAYTVYFMGGGPEGAERAAAKFQSIHPSLKVVGTWSPPFGPVDGELNDRILADIAANQPDILWVGLGAPRQEQWMWHNRDRIEAHVSLGVGAAFDYQSGKRTRAPRWMRDIGLEWSYRILREDVRLFWRKRYYAYAHEFIFPVLLEAARRSFNRRIMH